MGAFVRYDESFRAFLSVEDRLLKICETFHTRKIRKVCTVKRSIFFCWAPAQLPNHN